MISSIIFLKAFLCPFLNSLNPPTHQPHRISNSDHEISLSMSLQYLCYLNHPYQIIQSLVEQNLTSAKLTTRTLVLNGLQHWNQLGKNSKLLNFQCLFYLHFVLFPCFFALFELEMRKCLDWGCANLDSNGSFGHLNQGLEDVEKAFEGVACFHSYSGISWLGYEYLRGCSLRKKGWANLDEGCADMESYGDSNVVDNAYKKEASCDDAAHFLKRIRNSTIFKLAPEAAYSLFQSIQAHTSWLYFFPFAIALSQTFSSSHQFLPYAQQSPFSNFEHSSSFQLFSYLFTHMQFSISNQYCLSTELPVDKSGQFCVCFRNFNYQTKQG